MRILFYSNLFYSNRVLYCAIEQAEYRTYSIAKPRLCAIDRPPARLPVVELGRLVVDFKALLVLRGGNPPVLLIGLLIELWNSAL